MVQRNLGALSYRPWAKRRWLEADSQKQSATRLRMVLPASARLAKSGRYLSACRKIAPTIAVKTNFGPSRRFLRLRRSGYEKRENEKRHRYKTSPKASRRLRRSEPPPPRVPKDAVLRPKPVPPRSNCEDCKMASGLEVAAAYPRRKTESIPIDAV